MRNYKIDYWNQGEFKTEYVRNVMNSAAAQVSFHRRMKKRGVGKCVVSKVTFTHNSAAGSRTPEQREKLAELERENKRLVATLSNIYKQSFWSKKEYYNDFRKNIMSLTEPYCGEAHRLLE